MVLVTATLIMFGYFAGPGLLKDDDITQFISRTSLLLVPVVLLASWRRVVRLWTTKTPPAAHQLAGAG